MNTVVIPNYNGLFIYINIDYPMSYHDVNILRHSIIHQNWHWYFIHGNNCFEYLLGDPKYTGEAMLIMCKIRRQEIVPYVDHDVVWTFNKMHAGCKV
jgi:hypothetical protein